MSFSYEERVLVGVSSSTKRESFTVRLETFSQWDVESVVHPFHHLEKTIFSKDNLMPNDFRASIHVASRASQEFPMNALDGVPPLGSQNEFLTSPSGFWLQIETTNSLEAAKALVENWTRNRLVTTPLSGSKWQTNGNMYEIFLPTIGAAWSVDALQQMFHAVGACDGNFFGLSVMDWSELLVEGTLRNKLMWLKLNRSSNRNQISFGLQYDSDSLQDISSKPSCSFGDRRIQVVEPLDNKEYRLRGIEDMTEVPKLLSSLPNAIFPPQASVDQALRRTWANSGSLETWVSVHNSNDCKFLLRQYFQPFLSPSWHSLDIASTDDVQITSSLEWKDDFGVVLTLAADRPPHSLTVLLDYQPSYLSLDDFPGDPNRGRELPPAVLTLMCPHEELHLYSNSVLVLPPVPDMSMPFNVLSLSSSLYAYVIGLLVTIIVKRASEKITYKLYPHKKPKSKLQVIKDKIKLRLQSLRKTRGAQKAD